MVTLQDVMSVTDILGDIMMVVVAIDFIALITLYYLGRYDPRTFIAWAILLVFLPPVGFILYMYMGYALYDRMKFRKTNTDPRYLEDIRGLQEYLLKTDMGGMEGCEDIYRMARGLFAIDDCDYTNNNTIRIFTEGEEKMSSLFRDIGDAKESILVEYYIIRDDNRGNELLDLLIDKARQGLEVRLLVDGFGIGKGPKKAIARFKEAGGHYSVFHPGGRLFLSPKKNNRNHRKIAIIDGKVAYCGGFNIGDEYQGEGPLGYWRDASVRLVGLSVCTMTYRFSVDWNYSTKKDPMCNIMSYLDPSMVLHEDTGRVQVVSGGPETMPNNAIQMQYLSMIGTAKHRLYVCTPYLIPDDTMVECMKNAARSGVDIRIIIPDKPDHIFMYWNNLTYAYDLMKAGVRVYRYNRGFIHEKMMLMDDCVVSVGSANLDTRSFTLNFETNVMIYSHELCNQVRRQFDLDLEDCTEYSCEQYENSTLMERIRMRISIMFKYLA